MFFPKRMEKTDDAALLFNPEEERENVRDCGRETENPSVPKRARLAVVLLQT
jgi:hypothetical protein